MNQNLFILLKCPNFFSRFITFPHSYFVPLILPFFQSHLRFDAAITLPQICPTFVTNHQSPEKIIIGIIFQEYPWSPHVPHLIINISDLILVSSLKIMNMQAPGCASTPWATTCGRSSCLSRSLPGTVLELFIFSNNVERCFFSFLQITALLTLGCCFPTIAPVVLPCLPYLNHNTCLPHLN